MEAVPREQPEKESEWKWTKESGQVEEEHRLLPRTNVGDCEHPWNTYWHRLEAQVLGMASPESAEGSKVVLL